MLVGIAGALLPAIPGTPLSFVGLAIQLFREEPPFSLNFLLIMGMVMLAVTVIDYVIPVYGTKKFGGTKRGVWGSAIGLILAIFILPASGIVLGPLGLLGLVLGPFLGAYIAEVTGGLPSDLAMKAALGSFFGFVAGTMMKLAYSIVALVYFILKL